MDNNNTTIKSIIFGAISGAVTALVILNIGVGGVLNNSSAQVQPDFKALSDQEGMVVGAVEKSQSAVVSVIGTKESAILEPIIQNGQLTYRQNGVKEQEIGGGSGFFVSSDGYIVTNKHVVRDLDAKYTVFTNDGKSYESKVVARDPSNDIAVLKVDESGFNYLEFASSEKLNVGQTVIAIGNPLLEFSNSVSVGVISGLFRSIVAGDRSVGMAEQLDGVIQTDAAINPGNSGGPLLDLNGNVVGVNVAVASAENIGFSLPADAVSKVVDSVREYGSIVRPWLGVRYSVINDDYGVLIIRGERPEELAVIPGSPAEKAGLKENDIILEIDGQKLDKDNSLAKIIASKGVGDQITLVILRDGSEIELNIVLEKMDVN